MKVYVVVSTEKESWEEPIFQIREIYSNEEKAKAHVELLFIEEDYFDHHYEEWKVK